MFLQLEFGELTGRGGAGGREAGEKVGRNSKVAFAQVLAGDREKGLA